MHCTLFIPGLFWSRELAELALRDVELPALTRWLSRARMQSFDAITPEAWLCQAFELERQHDWPIAPLTLALDGGEPGEAYWLRADPVHLKVERDRLTLIDPGLIEIDAEEAQALAAALDDHFAPDGVRFSAPSPKRWYARFEKAPDVTTVGIREVAGGSVQAHLPSGPDAARCRRVFNEAQMVLHGHPVNEKREARGEPPVNSVWLWGGGTHSLVRAKPFDAVWSDDAAALALAALADAHAASVPPGAASVLAGRTAGGAHLVMLHELATACAYQDLHAWRDRVVELETRWFAPLVDALAQGRLSGLALVVPSAQACCRFDVTRGDLFKIWRRSKPVWTYS